MSRVSFVPGFDVLDDVKLPNGRRLIQKEIRAFVDGRLWRVPEGSITDYSSAPFWSRPIVRWDRIDVAGAFHDEAYKSGLGGYGNKITRKEADDMWRKIAEYGEEGANKFQSYTYWLGLRMYGWVVWNEYRRAD